MATVSSAEALLVEHLRYTPLSLIDDIINTINAIVYRALTAIESGLLSTPPKALGFDQPRIAAPGAGYDNDNDDDADAEPEERLRVEVEEGVHRLETLLEATVDRTFDKFEIYTLRNILWVPEGLEEWVRLRHYENLELPFSKSAPTPESITSLTQNLHATRQLNLTLSHTHASNDKLIAQLKSMLTSSAGPLSHLQRNSDSTSTPAALPTSTSSAIPSLTTSAQFTKSQLPALRSLLDDLRPRLGALTALAETGANIRGDAAERDDRIKYVEGVVERVVGTQLGATREADVLLGQRRTEEQVRAMERIAGEGVGTRRSGNAGEGVDDDEDVMEE